MKATAAIVSAVVLGARFRITAGPDQCGGSPDLRLYTGTLE